MAYIKSTGEQQLEILDTLKGTIKQFKDISYLRSLCFTPDDSYIIIDSQTIGLVAYFTFVPVEGGTPEQPMIYEIPSTDGRNIYHRYSPDGKWVVYVKILV